MAIELKDNDLVFAKVRPNAVIPTKDEENAGYDIYACFDEDYMILPEHTTKLIPTGIASAMTPKYEIRLRDRGSNGSKGIHVNAGTIDSGFRDSWFVAWCNTNDRPVILSKLSLKEILEKYGKKDITDFVYIPIDISKPVEMCDGGWVTNNYIYIDIDKMDSDFNPIIYPYSKAIAQAEVCEVPKMNVQEITYEELKAIPSKRGTGSLGSSGK